MKKNLFKKALMFISVFSSALAMSMGYLKESGVLKTYAQVEEQNSVGSNYETDGKITAEDAKNYWKLVNSMEGPNGGKTTDGIFVNYVESDGDGKFFNLEVILGSNLAENDGAKSVLANFKDKDLEVKVVDTKNGQEIATKTAKHNLSDKGNSYFEFLVNFTELNEKPGEDRTAPYRLDVYCDGKLVGTFQQHLSLVEDPSKDDSLKIKTVDGTETTDSVTVFSDLKNNVYVGLHPELHTFNKIKRSNDKKSVFKGKDSIRVDFVDENGEVKLSKNTEKQPLLMESDPEYASKMVTFNRSELDVSKSYTLKFYDGEELLGTKFFEKLLRK